MSTSTVSLFLVFAQAAAVESQPARPVPFPDVGSNVESSAESNAVCYTHWTKSWHVHLSTGSQAAVSLPPKVILMDDPEAPLVFETAGPAIGSIGHRELTQTQT